MFHDLNMDVLLMFHERITISRVSMFHVKHYLVSILKSYKMFHVKHQNKGLDT